MCLKEESNSNSSSKITLLLIIAQMSEESAAEILARIISAKFLFADAATPKRIVLNKEWEEQKHPRAHDGKFSSKGEPRGGHRDPGNGYPYADMNEDDGSPEYGPESAPSPRGGKRKRNPDESQSPDKEYEDLQRAYEESRDEKYKAALLPRMKQLEAVFEKREARRSKRKSGGANLDQQLEKAKRQYESLQRAYEDTDDDELANQIETRIEKVESQIQKLYRQKKGGSTSISSILPTKQPNPPPKSWLDRLQKAKDESDEEAIINVTDENGDVHEFTPEELDEEISKAKRK